jgi:hypothetical protein
MESNTVTSKLSNRKFKELSIFADPLSTRNERKVRGTQDSSLYPGFSLALDCDWQFQTNGKGVWVDFKLIPPFFISKMDEVYSEPKYQYKYFKMKVNFVIYVTSTRNHMGYGAIESDIAM